MRRRLLATLSLAACTAHANDVPTAWPTMDFKRAQRAIVVADIAAGKELPPPDDCNKARVVCLDSAFWYHAEIRQVLAGSVPERRLNVSTVTHQGMTAFLGNYAPQLVVLEIEASRAVMPKYQSLTLTPRRDGELFLVDQGWDWPAWLPCATPTLRETLDEAAMPSTLRVESYDVDDQMKAHRDLYHWMPGGGAFPRYGIAMRRLGALMATLKARNAPLDCPRADNQGG